VRSRALPIVVEDAVARADPDGVILSNCQRLRASFL